MRVVQIPDVGGAIYGGEDRFARAWPDGLAMRLQIDRVLRSRLAARRPLP